MKIKRILKHQDQEIEISQRILFFAKKGIIHDNIAVVFDKITKRSHYPLL
jgi:hypothetical protein